MRRCGLYRHAQDANVSFIGHGAGQETHPSSRAGHSCSGGSACWRPAARERNRWCLSCLRIARIGGARCGPCCGYCLWIMMWTKVGDRHRSEVTNRSSGILIRLIGHSGLDDAVPDESMQGRLKCPLTSMGPSEKPLCDARNIPLGRYATRDGLVQPNSGLSGLHNCCLIDRVSTTQLGARSLEGSQTALARALVPATLSLSSVDCLWIDGGSCG